MQFFLWYNVEKCYLYSVLETDTKKLKFLKLQFSSCEIFLHQSLYQKMIREWFWSYIKFEALKWRNVGSHSVSVFVWCIRNSKNSQNKILNLRHIFKKVASILGRKFKTFFQLSNRCDFPFSKKAKKALQYLWFFNVIWYQ